MAQLVKYTLYLRPITPVEVAQLDYGTNQSDPCRAARDPAVHDGIAGAQLRQGCATE